MQAGVNPLNSKIFFKKLRKPLDDRFLLFRAVAGSVKSYAQICFGIW